MLNLEQHTILCSHVVKKILRIIALVIQLSVAVKTVSEAFCCFYLWLWKTLSCRDRFITVSVPFSSPVEPLLDLLLGNQLWKNDHLSKLSVSSAQIVKRMVMIVISFAPRQSSFQVRIYCQGLSPAANQVPQSCSLTSPCLCSAMGWVGESGKGKKPCKLVGWDNSSFINTAKYNSANYKN